jgi:hypothetical protein
MLLLKCTINFCLKGMSVVYLNIQKAFTIQGILKQSATEPSTFSETYRQVIYIHETSCFNPFAAHDDFGRWNLFPGGCKSCRTLNEENVRGWIGVCTRFTCHGPLLE